MNALPTRCPVCGASDGLEDLVKVDGVPVHVGVLWPSREAAVDCPRGDLRMVACGTCSFVFNAAFDPALVDYHLPYDNSLHSSPLFAAFERDLVADLSRRHDLEDATVLEVGCGAGHFLGLLCEASGARGVGIDPSHEPAHADPLATRHATFLREPFGPAHADLDADLVCVRQVLEHLEDPVALLRTIRATAGAAAFYADVPNGLLLLEEQSMWDLMYEHCGYFTAGSLRRLLETAGFEVGDVREEFEGQFLAVDATPATASPREVSVPDDRDTTLARATALGGAFDERIGGWRERLAGYRRDGARVAAWGGGARCVSFFNMVGIGEEVPRVVDLNPRKQGTFLAGTGQPIVPPDRLVVDPPDEIIVINPVYLDEIRAMASELGITPTFVTA